MKISRKPSGGGRGSGRGLPDEEEVAIYNSDTIYATAKITKIKVIKTLLLKNSEITTLR